MKPNEGVTDLLMAWLDATAARIRNGDPDALTDIERFMELSSTHPCVITALVYVVERVMPDAARRRIEAMKAEPLELKAQEVVT